MMKTALFLILIVTSAMARNLYVIASDAFPAEHLSAKTVRAIFLDKKHLLADQPLLPLNYTYDNPLRICFERKILKKSRYALEHYWLQAHYRGQRPPKVIKSRAMLVAYLRKVPAAIGYTDIKPKQKSGLKILLQADCP